MTYDWPFHCYTWAQLVRLVGRGLIGLGSAWLVGLVGLVWLVGFGSAGFGSAVE